MIAYRKANEARFDKTADVIGSKMKIHVQRRVRVHIYISNARVSIAISGGGYTSACLLRPH